MPKYRVDFQKTVWGFATIEAETEDEALEMFEMGDCDEFETNSEIVSEDVSLA